MRCIAHILPLYVRVFACYHVLGRKGEVKRIANRKPSRSKLDQQILQAAILAVERLQQMLQDENASNGDVIKAASLIFDRLQQETGEGKPTGDFEIIMKEDT